MDRQVDSDQMRNYNRTELMGANQSAFLMQAQTAVTGRSTKSPTGMKVIEMQKR